MPVASLLPLFAYFLLGLILRKTGIVRRELANVLLRIVFHLTLPALAFSAIANASLNLGSILLPVIGFVVNGACLLITFGLCRLSGIAPRDAGALLLGASVANMVFIFPFIVAVLGESALVEAILFDLGNAVFLASVANSVAVRLSQQEAVVAGAALLRLLRTPLFIALVTAILISLSGLQLPELVFGLLSPLGKLTVPLTIVALGLSFRAINLLDSRTFMTVASRMLCGLLVGLALVGIFGLTGTTALVIIVSAAAPIGFSAVTLAAAAKLDIEQISAAVSLSIFIGMFSTTLLLWIGQLLL
jgi:predicted permease